MNCKLEKFWNILVSTLLNPFLLWTVNLKSFEIDESLKFSVESDVWTVNLKSFEIGIIEIQDSKTRMNCKLEKFWNLLFNSVGSPEILMNCKLEKFWNHHFLLG